jgi:hypothetical protein
MAIYTSFFVATDDEVTAGMPDWRMPPEQPTLKPAMNPFTKQPAVDPKTGQQVMVKTWDPSPPDPPPPPLPGRAPGLLGWLKRLFSSDAAGIPAPDRVLVHGHGDYHDYLEARVPAIVRANPHRCLKSIDLTVLSSLFATVTGADENELLGARPARLPPHGGVAAALDILPPRFTAQLAVMPVDERGKHALKWSEAEELEGVGADDVAAVLDDLCELAKDAEGTGKHLYLLTEW